LPLALVDKVKLFYRLEGEESLPTLVLSHSVGCDHGMWDPQVPDLLQHFRVLRYDARGHGASDSPAGEYSIDQLGRDFLLLADSLGISKFDFCGLSLGGAIGQWLALNAPDRVNHLILANTSPQFGAKENWNKRREIVLKEGMAGIIDMIMQRFFSTDSLVGNHPYVSSIRTVLLGTNPGGYAGCCSALRDFDSRDLLGKILARTLVISGDRDVATPFKGHSEIMARGIPDAQVVHLPAAHISNLEAPREFTAALLEFLRPEVRNPLEAGFEVRRQILGSEHVDRAIASTTDFNREFQTLITTYAWGTIWTRPGLDHRTRRLLVLAMMATLGRWEEFRMHVRAGLQHGLEACELKEVLLQVAIYAGVPAANTGFHIAEEELKNQKAG